METTAPRILFFGRNPAIMSLVKLHIGANGHVVDGYLEEKAITTRLRAGEVDLLVLGGGVEDGPRERCRRLCADLGVRLLEHYGGPDQLGRHIHSVLTEATKPGH